MGAAKQIFLAGTAITQAYFDRPDSALARVVAEAPYISRCSDNKTACLTRPRSLSTRFPYMQVNRRDMRSWLVFDIDYHPQDFPWEVAHLPAPNLVVSNRETGHCHLFYAIVPVAMGDTARTEPIAYMDAVYRGMAVALKADTAYRGPVAKTPGHPWWLTQELHNEVFTLGELAEYVELPKRRPFDARSLSALEEADPGDSRHWALFRALCPRAYGSVNWYRENASYKAFLDHIDSQAGMLNRSGWKDINKKGPLTARQVAATARSVARWTWTHYRGSGRCHRGVMALDSSIPLKVRQGLAARRTHGKRRETTVQRIQGACRNLMAEGKALTFVAIAQASGLTRQTVSLHRDLINQLASVQSGTTAPSPIRSPRPAPLGDAANDPRKPAPSFDQVHLRNISLDASRAVPLKALISNVSFGDIRYLRPTAFALGLGVLPGSVIMQGVVQQPERSAGSLNAGDESDQLRSTGGENKPLSSLSAPPSGSDSLTSGLGGFGACFGRLRGRVAATGECVQFMSEVQRFDDGFQGQSLGADTVHKDGSKIQDATQNALINVAALYDAPGNLTGLAPEQACFPDHSLIGDGDLGGDDVDDLSNETEPAGDG